MNKRMEYRQRIVRQAIANERLEGLNISRVTKKIADKYIAGKISATQAATKIRTHYGINRSKV